tara:strand:+ start:98 stop:1141 length:1044 start_codon:yes stop_codon:yes gene_type:complete
MTSNRFVEKIKIYTVASFIVPIIAINACLLIFKFMGSLSGDYQLYPNLEWDKKKVEYIYEEYVQAENKIGEYSFTNCPKYGYFTFFTTTEGKVIKNIKENYTKISGLKNNNKIKSITNESNKDINLLCIKNNQFLYTWLNNYNFLEKIIVKSIQKNQSFTKIKNPYFYGEVSISRTARYSPAVFVFKPLMILTAFLLLFYWVNILYFFNDTKINDETNKFSKKFFYFGILSCVFLILHVIFLGVSYDSELFQKMRRIIIILFILFEMCAQIFLTQSLFKFRNELKSYINPLILKIKIIFVSIAFFITCVSFVILVFYDPSTAFKHVLEWNYFTLLLFYYILSRLLFR